MAKLSPTEVDRRLKGLKDWKLAGKAIERTFHFKSYMHAIEFINRVARVAEEEEHHPDIYNSWRTVRLSLTTHDEGGLTEWDFDLAKKIDGLG